MIADGGLGDVSRETQDRLALLADRIEVWTRKINLIAPSTVSQIWDRHILDSMQIWEAAPGLCGAWADLGSGGGLPGLVVAILAQEAQPDSTVHMVESDTRKVAFLKTTALALGLTNCAIHHSRIEELAPLAANVVSARALAPLPRLMPLVHRHIGLGGTAVLAKGAGADAELEQIEREWRFDITRIPSRTDENGQILRLTNIERL